MGRRRDRAGVAYYEKWIKCRHANRYAGRQEPRCACLTCWVKRQWWRRGNTLSEAMPRSADGFRASVTGASTLTFVPKAWVEHVELKVSFAGSKGVG